MHLAQRLTDAVSSSHTMVNHTLEDLQATGSIDHIPLEQHMHSFTLIGDMIRDARRNIRLMRILEATCLPGTTPAQRRLKKHCHMATVAEYKLSQAAARADELLVRRIQELASDWSAELEEHTAKVISLRGLASTFLPTAKSPRARRTQEEVLRATCQCIRTAAAIVHRRAQIEAHANHAFPHVRALSQWASDLDELHIIQDATTIMLSNMD
jgi:hypothetical protein